MRSFSTFPDWRTCRLWTLAALVAVATGVVSVTPAYALDPRREMSQYIRDTWEPDRGFPGGRVHAIAQTADGYLWMACEKGLVRFDGLTFHLFQPSGAATEAGPAVLGVAVDTDGNLWARLQGPAVVRYRNGVFEDMLPSLGIQDSLVTAMTRGGSGAMLLATLGHGAVAYRVGQVAAIAGQTTVTRSFVISIAETAHGEIWLGTRDSGLVRVRGETALPIVKGLPDDKVNCLVADGDSLWIGTDNGVVRWHGDEVSGAGVPAALRNVRALALTKDRDANIWVATASHGLLRVNAHGVASADKAADATRTVTAAFEDRDGNLWIGTTRGIERWRDGVFTAYSSAQGLPSASSGPVYLDSIGRTWFAPSDGGLFWMRAGEIGRIAQAGLSDDVVYSIAGGDDDVWVGRQRGGLTRLRFTSPSFADERFTQADGLAQNSVYAVHRSRDGAVWAGTLSGGVSRLKDHGVITYTVASGLASNTVSAILETADGTMWFGTPNGVSVLSRGGWRRYTTLDGLLSNDVNTLVEDSVGNVWVGTAAGLSVVRAGHVQRPLAIPSRLRGPIVGLAEDHLGWLWIATADRVLRVNREQLARGAVDDASVREYGTADGLLGLEGVRRHRSVVAGPEGQIWFSMNRGLAVADASRAAEHALPALAHVEEVLADGLPIDLHGPREIPPGRRRITFGYTGSSLSVPERTMFRYRLDGFDRDWSEPVAARQAEYTNLRPGAYQFRVRASNSDGAWTGGETTVGFLIQPMFWQTTWFRLSIVMTVALAGFALYRLRVMQVARQLNVRFEERLAERTRIAQELHDTLLQGFLSASMQLHVAADRLPADSPAKKPLARVQDLMSRVIEEGRNAVRGLRSTSTDADDLEQALAGISQELAIGDEVEYRVIVEGRPRPLKPLIRDEAYRIGREALANAFRHSGAKNIAVELEYASGHLRMLVRDNGRGIDADVLRSGSEGHWGLPGMRERADRVGARFKVWSRAGAGTEVELVVPSAVAFVRPASAGRLSWATRWYRSGARRRREEKVEQDL